MVDWSRWQTDFAQAQQLATRTRRGIFLQFEKQGCLGCQKLYSQTYTVTEVMEELEQWFVLLKADIYQEAALRRQYQAIWTPSMFFLDRRGALVEAVHGVLSAEDLRLVLRLARARLLLTRGKFQEAEQLLAATVEQYPDNPRSATLLYWQGIAHYLQHHNLPAFQALLERLRHQFPHSPEAAMQPL